MAFLNNNKYRDIRDASKNGNEKAQIILQQLRGGAAQADLDRLVEEFYGAPVIPQTIEETSTDNDFGTQIAESEPIVEPGNADVLDFDLEAILDGEMEGLIDENELEDLAFGDFLKNKARDGLRARKGSAYFKAYDPIGRGSYMAGKINGYKQKFDGRLKDIDRRFNDTNKALGLYLQHANETLDDNVELDMSQASKAYDDFTTDEGTMSSFGRHWDENDNGVVVAKIKELIATYGKQNVIAALNTLNSDNESYRSYMNNQVDSEVSRYSKSIENLLK